jgi:DNA polymerase-3 subunit epsilon
MMAISDYIKRIKGAVSSEKAGDGKVSMPGSKASGKDIIAGSSFVVFDMEMSGLDPKKDFIVSIGALKMTGRTLHLENEFYRLVRPAGGMSKENVEIHGITPGELEGARPLDELLPEFLDYISDAMLVGHFVNFDIQFLNRAIRREYNSKLENRAVDTHSLHEWLLENSTEFRKHYRGGSTKTDLFSIAERYGITIDSTHNALSDAFITAQLFQRFLYFLKADGVNTLNELFDIGKA